MLFGQISIYILLLHQKASYSLKNQCIFENKLTIKFLLSKDIASDAYCYPNKSLIKTN